MDLPEEEGVEGFSDRETALRTALRKVEETMNNQGPEMPGGTS